MGFLGGQEVLIVALVVMVLFGGSRLGEFGRGIGTFFKEIKKGVKED